MELIDPAFLVSHKKRPQHIEKQRGFLRGFSERVAFQIGLFCTEVFTFDLMTEKIEKDLGIPLTEVAKFNVKGEVLVHKKDGELVTFPLQEAMENYQRPECQHCADFSAELADIACGGVGTRGWTIVVLRTEKGKEIWSEFEKEGLVEIQPIQENRRAWNILHILCEKAAQPRADDGAQERHAGGPPPIRPVRWRGFRRAKHGRQPQNARGTGRMPRHGLWGRGAPSRRARLPSGPADSGRPGRSAPRGEAQTSTAPEPGPGRRAAGLGASRVISWILLLPKINNPALGISLDDALRKRRSIRHFTSEPVPMETLKTALAAACLAPSPHGTSPWRFCILDSQEAKETLAAEMGADFLHDMTAEGVPEEERRRRHQGSIRLLTGAPALIMASLSFADSRRL